MVLDAPSTSSYLLPRNLNDIFIVLNHTDAFCCPLVLREKVQFYWFQFDWHCQTTQTVKTAAPFAFKPFAMVVETAYGAMVNQTMAMRTRRRSNRALLVCVCDWQIHNLIVVPSCVRVCVSQCCRRTYTHRKPCANVISRMGHTGTIVRDATVKTLTLTRKIVSILCFSSSSSQLRINWK